MSESSIEDDQEIAENIQARLFYEESTHDRIVKIVRDYKDQGFGYLDACTELMHVFVRMVERYSKQNTDMQVRSKRRARKKRQKAAGNEVDGNVDDPDDHREAEITSRERKFEFTRFQARFMSQAVVDTFVTLLKFYNDLSAEQLKRIHRYFYRLSFKNELSVLMFRLDIIQLLHKIVKGPEGLDTAGSTYKDWAEFSKQLFRRLIKKLEERPELMVEMLFSKNKDTTYYLEHGHDKELPRKTNRPAAELQIKPGISKEQGIGALVGLLLRDEKSVLVDWMKDQLEKAYSERQAWVDMDAARVANGEEMPAEPPKAPSILVRSSNDEVRKAMFKNGRLRLLMSMAGFERLGLSDDPEATWIVPSAVTPEQLQRDLEAVQKFIDTPQTYEDNRDHEDLIRRKPSSVPASNEPKDLETGGFLETDDEDGADYVDEEMLFPAGGPTARKSDAIEQLKKKRRIRRGAKNEVSDAEKARRANAREAADLEKQKKIKSSLFVHDSDDETDEERDREFFAAEEKRRGDARRGIKAAIARLGQEEDGPKGGKKRKAAAGADKSGGQKRRRSNDELVITDDEAAAPIDVSSDASTSDSEDEELATEQTSLSSQHHPSPEDEMMDEGGSRRRRLTKGKGLVIDETESETEDVPDPLERRIYKRAPFLVDSDDE